MFENLLTTMINYRVITVTRLTRDDVLTVNKQLGIYCTWVMLQQ